jgi:hypothetical protein
VDGVLRYERDRQRSLEFTQTCIVSWVRMAIMVSKLGVGGEFDLWTNGLGAGNSVKVRDSALSFPYNIPVTNTCGHACLVFLL